MKRGILANCAIVGLLLWVATMAMAAITVDIDIRPGSEADSINCNNPKEVITVAIIGTSDFDVTQVDTRSVEFEGAFEMHMQGHFEDIDGDGDIDLVFRFRMGDTILRCEDTEGKLTGLLVDGTPFEGTDAVKMVSLGP
ncbi:MAG: hypothetical protein GQ560_04950 [Dehalococcoidia bacterium]|nr:hypothetical protein [Dehalococcoidia bacterium]